MPDYRFVVFTNAVEGREDEFNRWYDDRHIPDVLAVPGFVAAQRLAANPVRGTPTHGYLTIYDMQTDDIEAVFADLATRVGTDRMPLSDALQRDALSSVYEIAGPRRTA